MKLKHIFDHIEKNIEETIETLFSMVSQPSVSSQKIGFDKAPDLLKNIAEKYSMESTLLYPDNNGFPSVFGKRNSTKSDKTLLFYTHYDVQPADPLELWESEPFSPERRDNRLYGRGMSDDKGNIAARLAAIKAFMDLENDLPVNRKTGRFHCIREDLIIDLEMRKDTVPVKKLVQMQTKARQFTEDMKEKELYTSNCLLYFMNERHMPRHTIN